MRTIYLAEIKNSWITWLGVCLTFIAANYGLAIGFLYIATGINGYAAGVLTLTNLSQLAAIGGVNVLFGAIVGAAVIGASTALVIVSRRGAFARLALAGATPGQVVRVVMSQLVVVTLACAVVGDLLAGLIFPNYLSAEASDREMAVPDVGQAWWAYLGANLLCVLIALIGGWKQARAASRIPPVEALRPVRETTGAAKRRLWVLRGLAIAACVLIIVASFAGFPGVAAAAGPDAGDLGFQLAVLILVVTGIAIIAAGPPALAALARGWAGLIPSPGGVWHLARTTLRVRAERFARSVTPIMFAVGLMIGMIAIVETLEASMQAAGRELQLSSAGPFAIFTLVGAPLIIAGAGAVGGLIMMARQRDAELALASIVGATQRQRVLISLFEAILITVTGVLAGLLMAVMAVGFLVFMLRLLLGVSVVVMPIWLLLGVIALCFAVAILATVGPILPALRKPAPAVIARLVSE
ncbi:FtsX-like permease family protein [Granulicoccus sp. GXG6511]|uniref:FtsX-like permease family protein n=1 Tax=Granulicoccus sp. GXG6511 TaxID=3381351 RepID=UPI003D7E5032